MVPQSTFHEQIRKLEAATSHEELLYTVLMVYTELFPVANAYLMRYSPLGFLAEGVISLQAAGLMHIGDIRDDIRSYPIVYSAIRERRAKYCFGLDFLKQTSSKYVTPSTVNSLLVVPICYGSIVIGYICSSESQRQDFDAQLLSALTLYGQHVGKALHGSLGTDDTQLLSKRELEVMRKIAWGESTKEMADSMDISEVTVKQYVKTAMKKLGAQNRSHAVGELFRRGLIS